MYNVWKALLTFHILKLLAYTRPLLMPVTCGVVFLLNILCLVANKFCYVLKSYLQHVYPLSPLQCELSKLFRKFILPCLCYKFVLLQVWRVLIWTFRVRMICTFVSFIRYAPGVLGLHIHHYKPKLRIQKFFKPFKICVVSRDNKCQFKDWEMMKRCTKNNN